MALDSGDKWVSARGVMLTSTHLLRRRRFLPLFVTQLFNAFNDNLYKTTMVLFVVYAVYNDETTEAGFSGLASALFILPFFILSALAGQLADMRDKAKIDHLKQLPLIRAGRNSKGNEVCFGAVCGQSAFKRELHQCRHWSGGSKHI